ncbi:piggyBac transposable element-derived protein 4-like [Metopolophium dirhodum]|uniref:piggyBac transposable element-derived protein 4-like n=1 Tax=Metopolophium dirhodum TaxID=44670 RepID=UPI00298F6476|nr:piggyBac transposable element-derived protein 4-like [Metopolophium dirhodum]
MPSLSDYWNKAERYQNKVAPKTMSRNKFELILRFWHFENNDSADKTDRLEIIAVDESMIPYSGRLKFRQYIPNKTHKYGVKFFKVCGSNGYTYKIIIYEGEQSIKGESLTETIVSDLCENYLNEGRTIVTDNFYTSVPPLAEKMLSTNTHLVGTLRKNRRFLPDCYRKKN